MPSRGVAYGSGLEPAPHLVGERARGLGLLEAGGLVAISAAALVERVPPRERRAAALHVERGGELVRDDAVAALVAAGYTRVERVGDRGELAVRGDILDVFPTTGAEPVRIELFGDEVERISRFSVFTQRSLAELERCDLQPAREARRAPADVEEWTHEEDVPVPNDLVALAPELIAHGVLCAWQPDRVLEAARDRLAEAAASHSRAARERAYVSESAVVELLEGVTALDPLQGDTAFEAQRPALAGRGIAEAEAELLGLVRSGLRVVVAFPHRGDAERTQLALRRVEATLLRPGQPLPDEAGRHLRRLAAAARRRLAGRRAWPSSRPSSCSGAALRAPRSPDAWAARSRAPPTCGRAITSSTSSTASAASSASTRRPSAASRATTSTSSSRARTGSSSRTTSSPSSRATSAPTGGRPRSRSSAARPGTRCAPARARPCTSSPASCCACTRCARRALGRPTRMRRAGSSAWSGPSPTPRPRTRAAPSTRCSRT